MRGYGHEFDVGKFLLYKDLGDGTAYFYKADDPINDIFTVPMLYRYGWGQMRIWTL